MPPAPAPTPAPTAAPTGPPTTAPVTAPVVAPAAGPFCACEAIASENAAAIVTPVNNFRFMSPLPVCEAVGERQRPTAVPIPNQVSCQELSSRFNISPASKSKRWEDSMEQVMHAAGVVDDIDVVEPVAGVSWPAVLAGAIASCALTLV